MRRFVSALKKSGDDSFAALLRTGAIGVSSVALLLSGNAAIEADAAKAHFVRILETAKSVCKCPILAVSACM